MVAGRRHRNKFAVPIWRFPRTRHPPTTRSQKPIKFVLLCESLFYNFLLAHSFTRLPLSTPTFFWNAKKIGKHRKLTRRPNHNFRSTCWLYSSSQYSIFISAMVRFTTTVAISAVLASSMNMNYCQGFTPLSTSSRRPLTALPMANEEASVSRREALAGFAVSFLATATAGVVAPEEASAKYSDYSRREKDWEERLNKGDVKISSARDLRAQLQEIAPMNTSSSTIFCPNGPSANVSPLMENKCGDRLAAPSVYGRSNDAMGNSIPGFKDGYTWSPGDSSSVSAAVGGFPTYKENEWKIRDYGK